MSILSNIGKCPCCVTTLRHTFSEKFEKIRRRKVGKSKYKPGNTVQMIDFMISESALLIPMI